MIFSAIFYSALSCPTLSAEKEFVFSIVMLSCGLEKEELITLFSYLILMTKQSNIKAKNTIFHDWKLIMKDNKNSSIRSFLLKVFNDFQNARNKGASSNFPSLLLGNRANAWPAIFSGAEEIFNAVDIGSLIGSLFLSSFFAGLIS